MKNVLLSLVLLVGCSTDKETVFVSKGTPGNGGTAGPAGKDGTNGTNGVDGAAGKDGSSCSVADYYGEEEQLLGSMVSCTDGSSSIILNGLQGIQGIQGATGAEGVAGANGASCSVSRSHHSSYATVTCGSSSQRIYDGEDGNSCSVSQTLYGARITCGYSVAFIFHGQDGRNGASCSVSNLSNGVRIICGNTVQDLFDGQNGTNGLNGAVGATGAVGPQGPQGPQGQPGVNALANAIGIKGYIYPCGQEFNNDEMFLRLTDGKILALYDGGANLDRLVLLAPGNYVTTDRTGRSCNINVSSNLTVTTSPTAATGQTTP